MAPVLAILLKAINKRKNVDIDIPLSQYAMHTCLHTYVHTSYLHTCMHKYTHTHTLYRGAGIDLADHATAGPIF